MSIQLALLVRIFKGKNSGIFQLELARALRRFKWRAKNESERERRHIRPQLPITQRQ
jgi:hypothetical protein